MSTVATMRAERAQARSRRARSLYKPDHPRSIDRYIDYFGNGGAHGRNARGRFIAPDRRPARD